MINLLIEMNRKPVCMFPIYFISDLGGMYRKGNCHKACKHGKVYRCKLNLDSFKYIGEMYEDENGKGFVTTIRKVVKEGNDGERLLDENGESINARNHLVRLVKASATHSQNRAIRNYFIVRKLELISLSAGLACDVGALYLLISTHGITSLELVLLIFTWLFLFIVTFCFSFLRMRY